MPADKVIGQNISFSAHITGVLISPPLWTVHIYSYCHPISSLIHIFSLQIWGIYPTVWRYFLLRIHTNTYPVLSVVLLQLFTPHNSVFIPIHVMSYQPPCYRCLHLTIIFNFVAANILLQRWKHYIYDNRSYTNICIIIINSIAPLVALFCPCKNTFRLILRRFRQTCETCPFALMEIFHSKNIHENWYFSIIR